MDMDVEVDVDMHGVLMGGLKSVQVRFQGIEAAMLLTWISSK